MVDMALVGLDQRRCAVECPRPACQVDSRSTIGITDREVVRVEAGNDRAADTVADFSPSDSASEMDSVGIACTDEYTYVSG